MESLKEIVGNECSEKKVTKNGRYRTKAIGIMLVLFFLIFITVNTDFNYLNNVLDYITAFVYDIMQ